MNRPVRSLPLALALTLAPGCLNLLDSSAIDSAISKDDARTLMASGQAGSDLCRDMGWYGDGVCDDFCPAPDPDCGLDSDADTVPDAVERAAARDTDGDGIPNYRDPDDDGDGIQTRLEHPSGATATSTDTDGDGLANYLDADDDGDRVPTRAEDVDGNGTPLNDDSDGDTAGNWLDNDDDGDGTLTAQEDVDGNGDPRNDDADRDGIPSYLDALEVTHVSDTTAPRVTGLLCTPNTVDVTSAAATVTCTVAVTDDLSGVSYGYLTFMSPGRLQQRTGYFSPSSDPSGHNTALLTIDRFAAAGTWTLENVVAYDVVGNYSILYGDALAQAGLAAQIGVTSVQDTTAPVLSALACTPDAVDVTTAAATVTCTADITDDLSGVSYGYLTFVSPGRAQQRTGYFSRSSDAGGHHTALLTIDRFAAAGTWTVENVVAYDVIGNYSSFYGDALAQAGLAAEIEVTSVQDSTAPVLSALACTPDAVDVSTAAATVTCTVDITDDLSGVNYGYVTFVSPGRLQQRTGYFFPSTNVSGRHTALLTIDRFAAAGTWTIENLVAYDAIGNYSNLYGSALVQAGFDVVIEVR